MDKALVLRRYFPAAATDAHVTRRRGKESLHELFLRYGLWRYIVEGETPKQQILRRISGGWTPDASCGFKNMERAHATLDFVDVLD
ncbi:hypothetical protein DPEC_G00104210 [Dallia pectoralis]|uniref:Uncharacterized protein n=1 Tax=Dallia pectoralis TaxID=75939 RepID=A0ACC2GXE3_DALPE|nr:hypothetical protein DPEC_G00104210 [Dallia pectoralis]